MSDEETVKRIQSQMGVAVALRMMAQTLERFYGTEHCSDYARRRVEHLNNMAGLFTAHVLRLIATHRLAVARWLDARAGTKWVEMFEATDAK
jgi:heme-degrading monooxygenase HmoA